MLVYRSSIRVRRPSRLLIRSTRGNASIEYALLAAFIGLGILASLKMTKGGLNTNLDKITLQIQRVNNDTSGTRKEIGRDSPFSYKSDGIQVDQIWIRYDDGSSVLYRTSPTPNAWFKDITYEFGLDGVNHGANVNRSDGTFFSEKYEYIRQNVISVTYSEGANTRNYIQEESDIGNGYHRYRQTMVSSNIANDFQSSWIVNYYGNDDQGNYTERNIGSVYQYKDNTYYNGGDITQYINK